MEAAATILQVQDSPAVTRRKAGDPRVTELLKWMADEYERKHSIPYKISWGKDGALVKDLLGYASHYVNPMEKLQQAWVTYITSPQTNELSIGRFASRPEKWMPKKQITVDRPKVIEEKKKLSLDEIRIKVCADLMDNRERFFKGFKRTFHLLKTMNPTFYAQIRQDIIDTVGQEEARRLFRDDSEMIKAL